MSIVPKTMTIPFVSNNLKNMGCIVLCISIVLAVFFTKFLVPILPLIIGGIAYFSTIKLRNATFKTPQKVYELSEGQVLLEGSVLPLEQEIISPYFKEICVGYLYKEIEYVPIEDGYRNDVKTEVAECQNFTLNTNSGNIRINGAGLDLNQISPRKYNQHSIKPDINDVGHLEYLLKNNDQVIIIGNAVKNIYQRLEIGKKDNEPYFVTTRSKIEQQKISFQVLKRLIPWMCILYLVVNYILFFAPNVSMPKNDVFAFVAIFGLPILFIIFWIIGRDKNDFISQTFQYLASVCIFSSLLSFPLIILFYTIGLPFYKIYYTFISIIAVVALGIIFNLRKLTAYDQQYEKIHDHQNTSSITNSNF